MTLRNKGLIHRIQTLVAVLILAGVSSAFADDNFAISPTTHDDLVIFGPKGERVTELSIPTISQAVTVGSTSFQISYGRDANNYITAIIAPSSTQPKDLHFTVLNKTIDSDKQAVVTLTFEDAKHVTVDPGYIGTVTVNSHALRRHNLADTTPPPEPTPAPTTTAPQPVPRTVAKLEPMDIPAPASRPTPSPAPEPTPVVHSSPAPASVTHHDSMPVKQPAPAVASEPTAPETSTGGAMAALPGDVSTPDPNGPVPINPPPLMGSLLTQPPMPPPKGIANMPQAPTKKLYWAEPITSPSGTAPTVGIDQMKLVAVHGPVSVKLPDGETKTGTDGMIVPSGSSVTTGNNGSAAVFVGGVDSARFTSNTEAKVTEKLAGSDRKTDINLRVGTVFARVGHRAGEKQDFVVRTPEGVAAAKGTSYAVCVTNRNGQEVTICATEEGVVTMTDSADGHQITITPLNNGQVSIGSVPSLPASILANIFAAFLADLQQFNTNMQAIANNPHPTPAQLAYYNANIGFDMNSQFYDTNNKTLEPLFITAGMTLLLDQNNPIDTVIPAARRAQNQQLEPFGNVPLTPY